MSAVSLHGLTPLQVVQVRVVARAAARGLLDDVDVLATLRVVTPLELAREAARRLRMAAR